MLGGASRPEGGRQTSAYRLGCLARQQLTIPFLQASVIGRNGAERVWATKEDEEGVSHDIDETEEAPTSKGKDYPDRKVDGIEMCQDMPCSIGCRLLF